MDDFWGTVVFVAVLALALVGRGISYHVLRRRW